MSPAEEKRLLRAELKRARREISPEARAEASREASARARSLLLPRRPRVVSLYGAMPDELDPAPLAASLAILGAWAVYPKVCGEELAFYPSGPQTLILSSKGIPEPDADGPGVPFGEIDAFLLPGLAFDQQGGRLGYGRGYYDRVLSRARPDALRIGFAFERQIVARVPTDAHDQSIHALVTERRTLLLRG